MGGKGAGKSARFALGGNHDSFVHGENFFSPGVHLLRRHRSEHHEPDFRGLVQHGAGFDPLEGRAGKIPIGFTTIKTTEPSFAELIGGLIIYSRKGDLNGGK